jgi:Tol biopolymer transport system component
VLGRQRPPCLSRATQVSSSFQDFSPDGSRVAFTWDEPHKRLADIYVKLVGPGDPVRLTTGTGENFGVRLVTRWPSHRLSTKA